MDDLVIVLRMAERLIVVGFAGLSIYLGYKLFFYIPSNADNLGKIELPGVKVVLSRVGPGIFFSVFGSIVLLQSLNQKIEIHTTQSNSPYAATEKSSDASSKEFVGAIASTVNTGLIPTNEVSIQLRTAIYEQVAELNCALSKLSTDGSEPTQSMKNAFRSAKIILLRQVWGERVAFLDTSPDKHFLKSVYYDTSVNC